MSASVFDLYRQWVLILCHQICLIFLSDICFGVSFLQQVSVNFVSPNLSNFSLLWSPISTESESWFCPTKSIWFCWATSALVSDLYRWWVFDFVSPNLFDFSEQHLLWCLISTGCECWFCATKSVWFFWATSALVSNPFREWALILCYIIHLILLSNICFGVWYLQAVSVDFVPPNLFDFSEWHLLWCC